MKKATTPSAAAKTFKTDAKIVKNSQFVSISVKKIDAPVLVFAIGNCMPKKKPYKKPQAVRELEELADVANAKAHPHMAAKYLAKTKYRDDTANGLTRCIIDWIKFHGGQAERVNTMGIPIDRRRQVTDVLGRSRTIGSVEWRPSGSTKGSSDISATIRGRAVKIEVKIGRDRQSEAQKAYQKEVEAAGGVYFVAKDFTSFAEWFNRTF